DRKPVGATGPSVHYTMIFNTFVFLQLFNEINARRIHDELNVFEGILTNHIYLGISVVQLVLQVLIIEFGSLVFGCVPLDLTQWFICIGLGSLSLPVGLFLRCITLPASFTMCQETSVVEKVPSARTKTLWRRSLKRLQVQMRVVKAFQKSVTQQKSGTTEEYTERDQLLTDIKLRVDDFAENEAVRKDAAKRKLEGVENSGLVMRQLAMAELEMSAKKTEDAEITPIMRRKKSEKSAPTLDIASLMGIICEGIEDKERREAQRLQYDREQANRHAEQLAAQQRVWVDLVAAIAKKLE
ncbi:hypothetical protein DYB28_001397, partial [Aphanomyces astaci]